MARCTLAKTLVVFSVAALGSACSSSGSSSNFTGAPDASRDAVVRHDAAHDSTVPKDVQGPPPPPDAGPVKAPQPLSPYIVTDQFGYRTKAEKIAVIRSPVTGFDSSKTFSPGKSYAVVDGHTGKKVLRSTPSAWNGGATDSSSGDKAWWFDFSSVTAPGAYYVLDESQAVRSPVFTIADGVYAPVMTQALRMYYYQRSGIAHDAKYAGVGWADGVNDAQDATCSLCPGCPGTGATKDVHGGWFDAGDQNRYTNWAATDVIQVMRAYEEEPSVFGDANNIPESGNGTPDILDEANWELAWLLRMQNADGSVQSIVGHAGASPPSQDTSPCHYGSVSTSSAYSAAAAFAYASNVFRSIDASYATQLESAAKSAWTWAQANPGIAFHNPSYNIGAGDSELDTAYGLPMRAIEAAVYLFAATGDATYRDYVDGHYMNAHMFTYGNYADMFEGDAQEMLLDYTKAKGATASVVAAIRSAYGAGMQSGNNFGSQTPSAKDPYLGFVYTYTWGSNQNKALEGVMFLDIVTYGIDASKDAEALKYAERYVHPFHGVNPLELVYLSNMDSYGASKSVTRFFHTWFSHTSALWNAVGVSKYGPPPGYVPGGPNPGYTWDGCCPSGCSGASCGSAPLSPPAGQPAQKSYLDFNDSWPLDSWEVTEPDLAYQANYVRLLAHFLK